MARSTLTSKGQITLPKDIREHLGLQPGDRINFEIRDAGVIIEPETLDIRALRGIVKKRGRVSLAAMDDAIRRGAAGK